MNWKIGVKILFGIMLVLGMFLIHLQQKPDFRNLSIDDVLQQSYYLYLLPQLVEEQYTLSRTISMRSFTYQCRNTSDGDTWNYIRVIYKSPIDEWLTIRISPRDAFFHRMIASEVPLDSPFSEKPYALLEPNGQLMFTDIVGNDIVLATNIEEVDLVEIAGLLVLQGINDKNPFVEICKS